MSKQRSMSWRDARIYDARSHDRSLDCDGLYRNIIHLKSQIERAQALPDHPTKDTRLAKLFKLLDTKIARVTYLQAKANEVKL